MPKLAKQTALYFLANTFSAFLGVANVVAFTHVLRADSFGDFSLGFLFATFFSIFLGSAIKLAVLRDQSRDDGTDVRPEALGGLILACALIPLGYLAARGFGLKAPVAFATLVLTVFLVGYDVTQELLRARQQPRAYLLGTLVRALLVSLLGIGVAATARSGAALLISVSAAYGVATLSIWRSAWGASRPKMDKARLYAMISRGAPLTVSLALLAFSGMIDRFLLANLLSVAEAGKYGASLDLVRQGLPMPAISIATAFVPVAVGLLAARNAVQLRAHLEKYLELLLAISVPACVGLALVAPLVADLVFGPNFRELSRAAMPIFCAAVLFQILTQQYFHTSFLLRDRPSFYLYNTVSTIAWNVMSTIPLILHFGVMGAVWGRLATEAFGAANAALLSRYAHPLPFPLKRVARILVASAAMGLCVVGLSRQTTGLGPWALALVVPAGILVYAMAAWLMNIAGAGEALAARFSASRAGRIESLPANLK